jgi:hypothetical protein
LSREAVGSRNGRDGQLETRIRRTGAEGVR